MANNKSFKYTEEQYKKYCEICFEIANNDDIFDGLSLYDEMNDWLEKENLSEFAVEQMDKRMEKEDTKEMLKESKAHLRVVRGND